MLLIVFQNNIFWTFFDILIYHMFLFTTLYVFVIHWRHHCCPWQFPVYHWTRSLPGVQTASHWSGQTEAQKIEGLKLPFSKGSLVWHPHETATLWSGKISPRLGRSNFWWWDSVWGNVQADSVTHSVWPLPVMVLLAPPGAEKHSW